MSLSTELMKLIYADYRVKGVLTPTKRANARSEANAEFDRWLARLPARDVQVTDKIDTAITSAEAIAGLPVGSVCVDPFDARGDAPVVLCRAVNGWAILGGHNERVWHDLEVLREAEGRLICVYRPAASRITREEAS